MFATFRTISTELKIGESNGILSLTERLQNVFKIFVRKENSEADVQEAPKRFVQPS